MKLRQWVTCLAIVALASALFSAPLWAQSPSVLYTWDQSIGDDADTVTAGYQTGPSIESWGFNFGNNALTLSNTTNGSLTVVETGATAGADWAITDSYNRTKEKYNGADYGGVDLTGLDSIEIEIGHNGPNTVNGQLFSNATPSSIFAAIGPISVAPGAPQVYSVPLSGLAPIQIAALRTIGLQIFDHAADGNLTWTVNEIRSAGTPLATRRVADYPALAQAPAPAAAFEGAIFNYDHGNVSGHTLNAQDNSGMAYNSADGALTWTEVPPAGGTAAGAAVTWGSGDGVGLYPPTEFAARPIDLSNYKFAHIRLRVGSTVAAQTVSVQYYTQGAGFSYHTAGPNQSIPADAQYHELWFPLASITDLDQTQFHGFDIGDANTMDGRHTGTWAVRVDYVEYLSVPEPASMALLGLGVIGLLGLARAGRGR